MRNAIFGYKIITRIASLIGMRRNTLASLPIVQLLLARVAGVVLCAFLGALLMGVIIVGSLWVIYLALVANGLNQEMALLTMAAVILLLIVILWMMIENYIQQISKLFKQLIVTQYPMTNRVSGVAHAFIDGIMGNARK